MQYSWREKNNQFVVHALMPRIRRLDLKQPRMLSLCPIKTCSANWLSIANNTGYQLPWAKKTRYIWLSNLVKSSYHVSRK